jgi:hypothetical protein
MRHFTEHLKRAAPDARVIAGALLTVPQGGVLAKEVQEEFRRCGLHPPTVEQLQRYLRRPITLPTKRDYETIGAGDLIDVVATPFELDPAFDDVAKIISRNLAAIILFPAVIGPLQAAPEIMTQAVVSGMFGH